MDGTDEGRWFKPAFFSTPRNLPLGELEHQKRKDAAGDAGSMRYPGQTWLLGYALPPFQRPQVWSLAQKVRFVESAARGLHLGTWVYNDAGNAPSVMVEGRECMARTDRWLIDGQQRFTALDEFLDDRFPVFGKTWSEIGRTDRRRFLNQTFAAQELSIHDEPTLRLHYDILNFGGVPHAPDQRALPAEEDEPASPGMR